MSEYTTRQILDMIEANGGPRGLDLSGKDLSGIDLSREEIKAKLKKVQGKTPDETPVWYSRFTRGIDLTGADLQGANLEGARLQGADLKEAVLQGARLELTKLQGAFLWHTNFQGADMFGAKLQKARLVGANLQEANLRFADLREVDLVDVETGGLRGIKLYRAKLAHTSFTALKREDLGPDIGEKLAGEYREARDVYLALKRNFEGLGDYNAASWAYCKERRMEKLAALKEAKEAWHRRNWKEAIPRYAKVIGDQVIECVCDYGEGFWSVVGVI
jgi:hypothetical protein